MNYYAIQVKTGEENRFIKNFKTTYPEVGFPLYFPQRYLDIRKRGRVNSATASVFPGYVFVEAANDAEITASQWKFRNSRGFFRFLKSNQEIIPLSSRDLEIVFHFIKNYPIAGKSRVYFNENSRIVVVDGPLLGLEGRIIKVDKRKGRAKIKLDLYEDSFSIDLSFEVIGSMEPAAGNG